MIMKKIMLIDDDKFVLGFMKFSLINAGYNVVSLSEGGNAVEKIKDEKPDLLVLDVLIPGLDGFKLAEELKKSSETANLKIIISSAIYKKDVYIETAKKLGVDGYIIKPINKTQFLEIISTVLNKS